jgi:Xaa-Pro dipeptidase
MFAPETYSSRRANLKTKVKNGLLFFPGNNETPMNYPANTYLYRQDSNFLYYWGIDDAHYDAVIDLDEDREILFGDDRPIGDVIWMGFDEPFKDKAAKANVTETRPSSDLEATLRRAVQQGRRVHILPQYRYDNKIRVGELLGLNPASIDLHASPEFVKAVIEQRSVKTKNEIEQIEQALDISYEMNTTAMRMVRPGMKEREVFGAVEGIALAKGRGVSFPIIFSVRGETLHNHSHENIMQEGDLLVLDSGAESEIHYASDITRSFPVSGTFDERQKAIYELVLRAQLEAIDRVRPGVLNKDIHLEVARIFVKGLSDLGVMKGDPEEAVSAGAHALFFPHGLGHMMGLDVHDMEGLGENYVGYDDETKRSEQFGLSGLRLAKELQPGYVLTVEPGLYFIPSLIDLWREEKKHADFINFDAAESYKGFGGVRIEDDVLVTENGSRVLGKKPIPKTVEEVEAACAE